MYFLYVIIVNNSNDYVLLDESGNNMQCFLNKFLVGISILLIIWLKYTNQL